MFIQIFTSIWKLLITSLREWDLGRANAHAAAISYFAVLSLAPLLIVAIAIASIVFTQTVAEETLIAQLKYTTDERVVTIVREIIENSRDLAVDSLATGIGMILLIYSASTVFSQLQRSIAIEWGLTWGGLTIRQNLIAIAWDRLLAGLWVIVVGGLLLLIMLVNTVWSTFLQTWRTAFVSAHVAVLTDAFQLIVALLLACLLFATIFKWLPPAYIRWRDVLPGAIGTALLFWIGNQTIWFFLTRAGLYNIYGTVGSLVAFLIWVYYLAWIVLFGVRFTYVYAGRYGAEIVSRYPRPS